MRWVAFSLALLVPLTASADPPRSHAAQEAARAAHTAMLASQRLLRLLGEARRVGDESGTTCVDGKLSQVNSFARLITEHRERLATAEAAGDGGTTAHVRLVLRNLDAQLQRLEREGRACVYPEATERGTTVVTIIERDVPDEDPSLWTDEDRRRWARR